MGRPQQIDQSKQDSLGQHLRSISRIPLLTAAEEINLARMVQRGHALEALSEAFEMRTDQGPIPTEAWALEAGITIQELKRQLKAAKRAKERIDGRKPSLMTGHMSELQGTCDISTDKNIWKVFWQRADLKWHSYEPKPTVKQLTDFLKLVDEDEHHCFKG